MTETDDSLSIEKKLDSIVVRIEEIEKKINRVLEIMETDGKKMNEHIDFIETVYDRIKTPFNYVMDKVRWIAYSEDNVQQIVDSELKEKEN